MADDAIRRFLVARGAAPQVVEGGLEYLVRGWERTAREVEDGYEGLIEEWLNDLDGRQLIEELRPLAPAAEWTLHAERIADADRRVRAGTVESDACLWGDVVATANGYSRAANWWYWRALAAG